LFFIKPAAIQPLANTTPFRSAVFRFRKKLPFHERRLPLLENILNFCISLACYPFRPPTRARASLSVATCICRRSTWACSCSMVACCPAGGRQINLKTKEISLQPVQNIVFSGAPSPFLVIYAQQHQRPRYSVDKRRIRAG
jgi:hypothetical protein